MQKISFLIFVIICNISFNQTSKAIQVEYLFINNNTHELSTVNLYFDENQAFSEFINIYLKIPRYFLLKMEYRF